jgi:hypothetical protein
MFLKSLIYFEEILIFFIISHFDHFDILINLIFLIKFSNFNKFDKKKFCNE